MPAAKPPVPGKDGKVVSVVYRVVAAKDYDKTVLEMTKALKENPENIALGGGLMGARLDCAAKGWNWRVEGKETAYVSNLTRIPNTNSALAEIGSLHSGMLFFADDRQGACKLAVGSVQFKQMDQVEVCVGNTVLGVVEVPQVTREKMSSDLGTQWGLVHSDGIEEAGAGCRVVLFGRLVAPK